MGRPKKDWKHTCPEPTCSFHQLMGQGNISAIGTYLTQSGKRRIFQCQACLVQFSETRDTVFFDLRTPEDKVIMALKMILVGNDLQDINFVLGVPEETLLRWLDRAAQQADRINKALLHDLPVTQVQLDEMWAFIARKRSHQAGEGIESPDGSVDGRQWVWFGLDPDTRLLLAAEVGPRTLKTATDLIGLIASVVFGVPAFFSDGLSSYYDAILAHYGQLRTPRRTGKPGRPRKPYVVPKRGLIYGQLIKKHRGRRLVGITKRIVLGTRRFKELGLKISTSLIERLNLTLRGALAPLTRKSLSFCKQRVWLKKRVTFFQAFYNMARPHMSLHEELAVGESSGARFERRFRQRTPGMVAGLSDHVWSFRELLTAKFGRPAGFQSTAG